MFGGTNVFLMKKAIKCAINFFCFPPSLIKLFYSSDKQIESSGWQFSEGCVLWLPQHEAIHWAFIQCMFCSVHFCFFPLLFYSSVTSPNHLYEAYHEDIVKQRKKKWRNKSRKQQILCKKLILSWIGRSQVMVSYVKWQYSWLNKLYVRFKILKRQILYISNPWIR